MNKLDRLNRYSFIGAMTAFTFGTVYSVSMLVVSAGYEEPKKIMDYKLGISIIHDKGFITFKMEGIEFKRVPIKDICK